jgi:hypothetical protein
VEGRGQETGRVFAQEAGGELGGLERGAGDGGDQVKP